MSDFDLRVISLGAGVQSTTLYRMAALGEIGPMPDAAIFADTQQEPPHVYENLERLKADHGHVIPIEVATAGDLGDAVETGMNSSGGRFAAVPFWVAGEDGKETPGRRQCTREYKIDVVKRRTRELLGLAKGQRAAGRFHVEEWVGISLDEATRAKPSRTSWVTTRWPLLEPGVNMRRTDCYEWLAGHGFPIPGKSACTFCPYRGPEEWLEWRRDHPELWEEACKWDDAIRSSGTNQRMRNQQFVLRLLRPMRDVGEEELAAWAAKVRARREMKEAGGIQLGLDDWFDEECEGMCDV